MNPKVSIIIPVYNGSNYLREAIDSALAQTYNNIEVIVVNDGSTDNGATENIAKAYGKKVRYFKKENGGVATALNFGINKMTGEYFSWLSHDDIYEKTKVEDEVRLITSLKRDDVIVACNVRVLFESGIKKKEWIDKKTFAYPDIFFGTSASIGVNGCALLIPRKALIDGGGFDPELRTTQDYDLWFRLLSKFNYRFVLLEKHLLVSRRHDKQDSVQKQAIHADESDQLHNKILQTIGYKRFEEYFRADKGNIKHALGNYRLYRERGYNKTAALMLEHILRFYRENDTATFKKLYKSEVESPVSRVYKPPKTQLHRVVSKLGSSIQNDGIYLSGEKLVRKVYRKLTNK